jgi:hypothetical protein
MKAFVMCAFIFMSCAPTAVGQTYASKDTHAGLTGNLRWDLILNSELQQDTLPKRRLPSPGRKSALTAALLSAAVPGAGEFYSESYWKAGSFLGAEIILWIVYATRTAKGDAQTDQFQQYADTHWSVVRYAQWIEANAAILNPSAPPCNGIVTNPTAPAPWDQVDWNVLNQCEANIGGKASTGFSHLLPRRPDQQYFELIGKYLQYNAGWDDWGASGPTVNEYLLSASPRFLEYRDMRGRANDFYNIASTTSFILVANHVLSSLDAAWSASEYNSSIKLRAHLQPTVREFGFVEFVPTATFSMTF